MGCEVMIDVIEKFIDNETSKFARRNIQKALNDDRRIDTLGLEFITTPAIKVAFENFKYALHRHKADLIRECEERQRQEERPQIEVRQDLRSIQESAHLPGGLNDTLDRSGAPGYRAYTEERIHTGPEGTHREIVYGVESDPREI